jgi:predicted phosphodiesterase
VVTLGGRDFYMLHNVQALDLDPAAAGFAAVLYGHSHKPEIRRVKDVLYFNPGSCGPRRFQLPVSFGRIEVGEDGGIVAEVVEIKV